MSDDDQSPQGSPPERSALHESQSRDQSGNSLGDKRPAPADFATSRPTVPHTYIDFATTVDIDRPAQDVWALLADYGRDPDWRAGVLSMTADPPGRAAPGTTTAEVMRFAGRTLRNNGMIVRVGPGHQLAWRTTSGIDANGVRAVEPRGPHHCRARLATRVRPHGFDRLLAPLAHLLLQWRITRDGRRLRSLAERADAGPRRRTSPQQGSSGGGQPQPLSHAGGHCG